MLCGLWGEKVTFPANKDKGMYTKKLILLFALAFLLIPLSKATHAVEAQSDFYNAYRNKFNSRRVASTHDPQMCSLTRQLNARQIKQGVLAAVTDDLTTWYVWPEDWNRRTQDNKWNLVNGWSLGRYYCYGTFKMVVKQMGTSRLLASCGENEREITIYK